MGTPSPEWCGMNVSCSLKAGGEAVHGEVFCVDISTGTIVLIENKVGQHIASYRFLKTAAIDLSTVKLSGATVVPEPLPPLADSVMTRIREKEKEILDKEKQKVRDEIGSGVSRTDQLIFNGLKKTMPCKWDGKDIMVDYQRVDNGARIKPPYTTDMVTGSNPEFVARVKKVLEGERGKLT